MSKITIIDMKFENYNDRKGFFNDHINWYQSKIILTSADHWTDIVEWLFKNIENPTRHARWYVTPDGEELYIKFRHQKDAIWFNLRW